MSSGIVNIALRGAQALFAAVVLGLSIALIKGQGLAHSLPATLGYAAFVGGISLLAASIGLAATWVELLQGITGVAIDVVITLLNLAGGIIIAIKLKGANCGDTSFRNYKKLLELDLLNGGCVEVGGEKGCYYEPLWRAYKLNSRCKQNQADSAFMFLTAFVLVAAATMTYLHLKRR